jgi:hypothetical protein
MKRGIIFALAAVFMVGMLIVYHRHSHHAGQGKAVLPSAELFKCRFGECAQMWSSVGAKPGDKAPWRVTIERLGNDPCPNGIVAFYDKSVSMEELVDAVTEQYGPAYEKGPLPGGDWRNASKHLAISLVPLADKSSLEERPSSGAKEVSYFSTADAFHDAVGRSVPRKGLKELIFLSVVGTSCGVPVGKPGATDSRPAGEHPAEQGKVVLPNPELLHCRIGECAQMWSSVGAKPDDKAPWRVTIERLGNDPCPNGIIALYDKNVSTEELLGAVTEQYGSATVRNALPGGIWKDDSKHLVISLLPLANESSPQEHPSADTTDGVTYFLTTDAFHDSIGRSVPREELKELIFLSTFDTSCGVHMDKP